MAGLWRFQGDFVVFSLLWTPSRQPSFLVLQAFVCRFAEVGVDFIPYAVALPARRGDERYVAACKRVKNSLSDETVGPYQTLRQHSGKGRGMFPVFAAQSAGAGE